MAARRGFIRTTAQAYAAALASGVSVSTILAFIHSESAVIDSAVIFSVAVVSPLIAGLASYLDIIAKGVPADYVDGAASEAG